MSAHSASNAYSYAKFLVKVYPDDAVDILRRKGTWDIVKLVEEQTESACAKLPGSTNAIKGMIENREWKALLKLKNGENISKPSSASPIDCLRDDARPPTPSSTASRSPQSTRPSQHDWICVYHDVASPVTLTSKPSGSEDYLIGEDKLDRFQDIPIDWISSPKPIEFGGRRLNIAGSVNLTWNHTGEGGTRYNRFWVVPPGTIRLADVLLGYRSQGRHNKAVTSPLSLAQGPPPAVPTPPVFYQARGTSSTAIYSQPGATVRDPSQGQSQNGVHMSTYEPLRPPGRTATILSDPLTEHHDRSSSRRMDQSPARAGSIISNKTTKSSKLSMVTTIRLSFEGSAQRLVPLDLTKSADEVIPYLESQVLKISGQEVDISLHEIKITPLKKQAPEPEVSSLSEIDYVWDALVEYMNDSRGDKKPEFQVAIYRPG